MNFMRKNRGFTLIELLVVIAIIGILASVVLASLNDARKKSRDARRVADIKQIQLALELYFDSKGTYTTTGDKFAPLVAEGLLAVAPDDPVDGRDYSYAAFDNSSSLGACDGSTTACLTYHVGANMEGDEDSNPVLKTDADKNWGFDGDTTDCATTAGLDGCYDLIP